MDNSSKNNLPKGRNPTKVGVVTWFYLPHPGGVEFQIKTMSEELTKNEIKVEILTSPSPEEYKEDNPDINLERDEHLSVEKKDQFEEKELINFITDWIEEKNIDILHVHNFHLPLSLKHTGTLYSSAVIEDIPVILHVHNTLSTKERSTLLESYGWDAVVPVSKFIAREICDKTEFPPEKVEVIPNAVNVQNYRPRYDKKKEKEIRDFLGIDKRNIITCPTRILGHKNKLVKRKGVKTFVHSLSHLSEELDNFVGVLTGAEDEKHPEECKKAKDSLRSLAEALDVEDHFIVPEGTIPEEKLRLLFSFSDVISLPSTKEAFGIVYIEGMASGKPIVGCSAAAAPEVINNGETGFLVDTNSPSELSDVFKKLLTDNELRKEMGKNAREVAKNKYSASAVVKDYIELYNSLLDKSE